MGLLSFRQLKSFILFEQPFNYEYLTLHFRRTQEKHQEHFNSWPFAATRRKLINDFWFWALCHYTALVAICGVVLMAVLASFNLSYLLMVLIVGFYFTCPYTSFYTDPPLPVISYQNWKP